MRIAAPLRLVPALLLVAGATAWTCAQELVLTDSDHGKTFRAFLGQSILVNLRGNPSTGYTWLSLSSDGDSVVADGPAVFIPDPDGGVGNGGIFSFPWHAAQLGETTVAFVYLQPWDPASLLKVFSATIAVRHDTSGPRLSISRTETDVVFRWPQAGSDRFVLEGTSSLSLPHWGVLNVLVLPDGTNYQATLPAADAGLFFRLRN